MPHTGECIVAQVQSKSAPRAVKNSDGICRENRSLGETTNTVFRLRIKFLAHVIGDSKRPEACLRRPEVRVPCRNPFAGSNPDCGQIGVDMKVNL